MRWYVKKEEKKEEELFLLTFLAFFILFAVPREGQSIIVVDSLYLSVSITKLLCHDERQEIHCAFALGNDLSPLCLFFCRLPASRPVFTFAFYMGSNNDSEEGPKGPFFA